MGLFPEERNYSITPSKSSVACPKNKKKQKNSFFRILQNRKACQNIVHNIILMHYSPRYNICLPDKKQRAQYYPQIFFHWVHSLHWHNLQHQSIPRTPASETMRWHDNTEKATLGLPIKLVLGNGHMFCFGRSSTKKNKRNSHVKKKDIMVRKFY